MTQEILERSLRIRNKIVEIKNVLNSIVSDDGQINRLKKIEVRVKGHESSTTLDGYNSDQVISMLCKEVDKLKEEFENIKA